MSDPAMRQRIRESNLKAYADPQLRARIGTLISAANQNPESKKRRSDAMLKTQNSSEVANKKRIAMKTLLNNKRIFCQEHNIIEPGKSYSNIDKVAFANWLSQHKEAA